MGYIEVYRKTINTGLDGAEKVVDAIATTGPTVIREIINSMPGFSFVKDWAADQAISALEKLISFAREVINMFRELLEMLGSPEVLREAATQLREEVHNPAEEMQLALSNTKGLKAVTTDQWDNPPANERYKDSFTSQSESMELVPKYSLELADALSDMADDIEEFYKELAKAVISAASAIVSAQTAIATAVTGVGVPVAVAEVIAAILSAVSAIQSVMELIEIATQERGTTFQKISLEWAPPPFAS